MQLCAYRPPYNDASGTITVGNPFNLKTPPSLYCTTTTDWHFRQRRCRIDAQRTVHMSTAISSTSWRCFSVSS